MADKLHLDASLFGRSANGAHLDARTAVLAASLPGTTGGVRSTASARPARYIVGYEAPAGKGKRAFVARAKELAPSTATASPARLTGVVRRADVKTP